MTQRSRLLSLRSFIHEPFFFLGGGGGGGGGLCAYLYGTELVVLFIHTNIASAVRGLQHDQTYPCLPNELHPSGIQIEFDKASNSKATERTSTYLTYYTTGATGGVTD